MSIERKNPPTVAAPLGTYSHLAVVPAEHDLLVLAGQVGNDSNGYIPSDPLEQLHNAIANVVRILASEGLDTRSIIKVNLWLTKQLPADGFGCAWKSLVSVAPPPATLAYVSALASSDYAVELEVWAARPARCAD